MAEGKASYSNMTIEAEVRLYEPKNSDFIRNISNSDDYDVLIVNASTKGRNYDGHEWVRFFQLKILGSATTHFEESVKPGDILLVRGKFDINAWLPKDADEDDEPNENEILVIDPRAGGFWGHANRWVGSVALEQEERGSSRRKNDDDEEDEPRNSRRSSRRRDDDDEEETPRKRRGRSSRDDDEENDEEDSRSSRRRRGSRDNDDDEEEPRSRRRRSSRDDDDEEDEPRGRSRRRRSRGDDDED